MDPEFSPAAPGLPPIVLFVEDDHDTLDMYATYFELSGVWVAKSTDPTGAMTSIADLHPDLIVTDMGFGGRQHGAEFVELLKTADETRDIPVIVLTGRGADEIPAATRESADLCLVKPVLPDALLVDVRRLVAVTQTLRERSALARAATAELEERSAAVLARAAALARQHQPRGRRCPECDGPLAWIEQGQIRGAIFDYYRRCAAGCGLYCFDQAADKWVKLV